MPKPTERRTSVELTVSTPTEPDAGAATPRQPFLPWAIAALIGSASAVLLGWLAVGVVVSVGWITAPSLSPATVLDTISQGWLGMHGVAFRLAGLTITMPPLGLSALVAVAMGSVASYATVQMDEDGEQSALLSALKVAGTCTGAYTLVAVLLASVIGAPSQAASCFVGAVVLSGVGSLVGALRASGFEPAGVRRAWTIAVPSATLAGLGVLVLGALSALVVAIASHWGQIAALQAGLAPDGVGAVLLVVLYAAYLPNLLLWAGSYVLGAGLSVGTGTLLTPWGSQLGLLPAIPLAGALPTSPPALGAAWLVTGPLAGMVVAAVLRRRLASARIEATPLAWGWRSAVAGLATGVVWTALSWFSRGALGSGHLVNLGPRFPELLAFALGPVAGVALAAGVILARAAGSSSEPSTPAPDSERDTIVVKSR